MAQLEGGRDDLREVSLTLMSPKEEGTRGSDGEPLSSRESGTEEGTRRTSRHEDGSRRSPSASSDDTWYSLDTKGLSLTSIGDGLVDCMSNDEGGRELTPTWLIGSR